jgi:hypothetical protein
MQVRGLLHVAKGLGQLQAAIACIFHKADPGNLDQCELADDERVWAVILCATNVDRTDAIPGLLCESVKIDRPHVSTQLLPSNQSFTAMSHALPCVVGERGPKMAFLGLRDSTCFVAMYPCCTVTLPPCYSIFLYTKELISRIKHPIYQHQNICNFNDFPRYKS